MDSMPTAKKRNNIGVIVMLICIAIVALDGIINVIGKECWGNCQAGHSIAAIFILGIGYAIMYVCADENKALLAKKQD